MTQKDLSIQKALVAVLEDVATATAVVEKLFESGFAHDKIELVTNDVREEAPQVETPNVHETTTSSMVDSAGKWGSLSAGAGLLVGLLTPFPGIALGMALMGGVVGAFTGGIAGIQHAVEDDSVNLPTLQEYKNLITNGHCLVVVQGIHDEVMRAEEVIKRFPDIHQHIHPLHGHEYHEHPARQIKET